MDVNESGAVTLDWLQPEVGTEITATLKDADGAVETDDADAAAVEWEWFISAVTNPQANIEGHWTSVTTVTATGTSTYIPLGDCVANTIAGGEQDPEDQGCNHGLEEGATAAAKKAAATARDEGKYLRVKATYTDRLSEADDERTAVAVSANPVRAEVSSDRDNVENPDNGSPGFTAGGDYARSVPESTATNMPVGDPVVAVDPNSDTLTYELIPTTTENVADTDVDEAAAAASDLTYFKIDKATGQISVAKTLDYDSNPDRDNPDGKYKIKVMATDPSGEDAEVEVTITATSDNDAPVIKGSLTTAQYTANSAAEAEDNEAPNKTPTAPAELRVYEKDDDDEDNDGSADYTGEPDMKIKSYLGDNNLFVASDEDARGQIFWELRGEDADDFVVSSTGIQDLTGFRGPDEPIAVRFASPPDYENPTDANSDSVYKVTLVARDSAGAEDERALTVFVDNVNEAGEATLSTDQPLIGQVVTATVSDPDNSVTVVTWRWERATSTQAAATWEPIPGATTGTYVPWKKSDDDAESVKDDDSMFLRAIATYIDTTSETDKGSTGNVDERVQRSTVAAPEVPIAKVASTTKTGIATVTDADGTIDMKLYRVMVTSANAVRVAELTVEDTPTFAAAPYERMVAENSQTGALVGAPVMASYGDPVMYSIGDIDANDNKYFEIDPYSGQIRVGSIVIPSPTPADQLDRPTDRVGLNAPVSETDPVATTTDPDLDYETKDTYTLLITAADRDDSSKKTTATVAVKLTDQNEAPYFDKETRQKVETTMYALTTGDTVITHLDPRTVPIMYAENRRTPAVALAAIEPDGASIRWELTGEDASDFMIEDIVDGSGNRDRVELVFKSQPDFEGLKGSSTTTVDKDGEDIDEDDQVAKDTYQVTVRATEMTAVGGGPARAAELDVHIQVTNVNEGGSVSVKWLQPEVGTALPATLSDVDGPHADATGDSITIYSTQWFRAKVANPSPNPDIATLGDDDSEWEVIDVQDSGDDTMEYTPQGTDNPKTPAKEGNGDEGWHLLVRVEYDDAASANNTNDTDITDTEANEDMDRLAVGMTANPVRANVADGDNNSPDFEASNTERTIPEDTAAKAAVGLPVMVRVNEDNDTLTYELVGKVKTDAEATDQASRTPIWTTSVTKMMVTIPLYSMICSTSGSTRLLARST